MAGMMRKLMRSVRKGNPARSLNGQAAGFGTVRAGMHQMAEHAYRRSLMTDAAGVIPPDAPEPEDPSEAILEETAENVAGIVPDEEILEETADPDAAEAESSGSEKEKEEQFSVDYSDERIPELEPVTGGVGVDIGTELAYSSGDGSLREIPEPLPGLECTGIPPFLSGMEDPSANVAAYEAPEAGE